MYKAAWQWLSIGLRARFRESLEFREVCIKQNKRAGHNEGRQCLLNVPRPIVNAMNAGGYSEPRQA